MGRDMAVSVAVAVAEAVTVDVGFIDFCATNRKRQKIDWCPGCVRLLFFKYSIFNRKCKFKLPY